MLRAQWVLSACPLHSGFWCHLSRMGKAYFVLFFNFLLKDFFARGHANHIGSRHWKHVSSKYLRGELSTSCLIKRVQWVMLEVINRSLFQWDVEVIKWNACKKYIGKDGRYQIVSRLQVRPHAWPCPLGSQARLTCALMTPYCKLMTSSQNLLGAFQPLPEAQYSWKEVFE